MLPVRPVKPPFVLTIGIAGFGLLAAAETWWLPSLRAPGIDYYSAAAGDPIAKLQKRMDRGETELEFDGKWGYLESLLKELRIPESSQTLVFSKTSLQVAHIGPDHPRALYFNDDVYLGMVRGGLLEIAEADPVKGAVFYTLEQKKAQHPRFVRRNDECLKCHFSANTLNIPGFLTRSVFADSAGEPLPEAGSFLTDHRSPLSERWGGWYVTGTHGAARHMGNAVASGLNHRIDSERGANLTSLEGRIHPGAYPEPGSDIVALMVLNHQVRMHNLFARLSYEARLGRSELPATAEAAVRYILFADEAPLRDKTAGTGAFRSDFEALGPFDSQGRSLRQFDLDHRIFRYPCSFLIYSPSFDALPDAAKDLVYRRLFDVLSGEDRSGAFARLTPDLRSAILEILIATKPALPAYFRNAE
ncbi:MAG: hypothetical protein KGN84_17755 [Acidobacteriota bacterium]|nr:hypothetical protein [Acidobacteriota bacterium]